MALEDERRGNEEFRQSVTILERKRIALQTELEDLRSLLETVRNKTCIKIIITYKFKRTITFSILQYCGKYKF